MFLDKPLGVKFFPDSLVVRELIRGEQAERIGVIGIGDELVKVGHTMVNTMSDVKLALARPSRSSSKPTPVTFVQAEILDEETDGQNEIMTRVRLSRPMSTPGAGRAAKDAEERSKWHSYTCQVVPDKSLGLAFAQPYGLCVVQRVLKGEQTKIDGQVRPGDRVVRVDSTIVNTPADLELVMRRKRYAKVGR